MSDWWNLIFLTKLLIYPNTTSSRNILYNNSFFEGICLACFYEAFLLNRENVMLLNLIAFPTYLIYCFIIYGVLTIKKTMLIRLLLLLFSTAENNDKWRLYFFVILFRVKSLIQEYSVLTSVTNDYRTEMFSSIHIFWTHLFQYWRQ